ncbi:MAG: ROK family protein [Bacteroidetes bacterium]|nr:MAG: ROK family protein [Bacteroidota bacterium]
MKELCIGIDIGGTNTVIGVVDIDGNFSAENSFSTKKYKKIDAFIEALKIGIKECLDSIKTNYILKGIGIGAPNGNYYNGSIEYAPNLNWYEIIPLADILNKHFHVPVVLTNDANAAAMGEMIYGSAKGLDNFIVITLGTGLGSGLVVDGKVVYGHDGFAGEIGHTIYDPNGRLCGCGRKGCLETYASATGIKRTVIELLNNSDTKSILIDIPEDELNSKDIYEAAVKGDKIALDAFDYTAKILGLKLADSIAYTSPEAIFLFGGLALSGDYILKPTKKYMEENLLKIYKNKVRLELSGLMGKNAAILGAAALIWKEFD